MSWFPDRGQCLELLEKEGCEPRVVQHCAAVEELALKEGRVAVRRIMGLSLTHDHRTIDGAAGARFLQAIVALLEDPVKLG